MRRASAGFTRNARISGIADDPTVSATSATAMYDPGSPPCLLKPGIGQREGSQKAAHAGKAFAKPGHAGNRGLEVIRFDALDPPRLVRQ